MNEFNDWLVALGFNPEALTPAQKTKLQAQWRAEQHPAPAEPAPAAAQPAPAPAPAAAAKPADTLDDILERARQENARVQAITAMVASHLTANPDRVNELERIGRLAIDGKWDVQKADLELLRSARGPGPLVYSPSQPDVTGEVVEAALCRMGGLKTLEKDFAPRTLDAVDRTYRRGIGLHQLIGLAARQRGWRGDSVKHDLARAMKFANRESDDFGDGRSASVGPSTISVSGILSNVANKFLKEAFMFVESEWAKISAVRSVPDFKQVSSYSLTGDMTYDKVAPGGELKHGTLGNETYTNQADTYGKIIGIDRRDLINDDLGAFNQVSRRLGRGGALKINEVFWKEFLSDPSTFWTAGRGNYDDGTDTAFSNDGLTAADVIWRAKTDPDGKLLGAMAKILLVPSGLRIPALRLMSSQSFGTTGEEGESNPWAGMFEVVSSRYLSDSNMGGGYSALAWYLLADPQDMAVIEICFLNGQQMPTVESVDMDGDRLGMAMRAYHDFGVNQQEYRAGLKLKGEA